MRPNPLKPKFQMMKGESPVAIVGLSLRYPGFCGPAAFFNSCRLAHSRLQHADRDTVRPYLQDHPRGATHPYRINNDLYGSIREMSWIDARRFRVPPNDIEGDPSPFLCLQVASEALLDFQGSRPDDCIPRERTGVVIGRGDHPHRGLWSGLQGGSGFEVMRELLLERSDLFTQQQVDALIDVMLMRMRPFPEPSLAGTLVSNVISGLVANRLDLQGPNFLVDAACTSAIVAIQQAVRSLYADESDLMLVGASQATMAVPIIQMFSMIGAISSQDVQPFNFSMDGTLLSEGVGFVALKRLSDAKRDGDRIYAVIRGFGLASDGNDSSILAPSSRGQILAMRNTYDALDGIQPDDIGFLEAHATGINLGDQTELNSIRAVFKPQERRRPLALGTLKSLIGHSIPASGMAALIRAAYAVAFGIYPVSRCDHPSDQIKSVEDGLFLPPRPSPWYEPFSVPRRAAINCFGFGGINGHLVLEQEMLEEDHGLLRASGVLPPGSTQNPDSIPTASDSMLPRARVSAGCPVQLICLSFNDAQELQTVATRALDALAVMQPSDRSCLLFSAGPIRPGTYRLGLVDRDLRRLQLELQALRDQPDLHHKQSKQIPEHVPELAVMLPGEALIPFGYLSELSRYIPSVKALLEFVDSSSADASVLADCLHPAWSSLLSETAIEALQKVANHHDYATKILFVVSVAYVGLLRSLGLEPTAFVGHSTGEINALMLAGGLLCRDKFDVQSILRSFGELYADSSYLDGVVEGTVVLAAGLTDMKLTECLEQQDDLYLVSDNSPSHRLIFSRYRSLDQLSMLIGGYGGFVMPTQLDRAYHTPLFESGAETMRLFYEKFSLRPVQARVYSCCSTEPYPEKASEQIELLVRQWTEPVRFQQTLRNMYRDGYRCFLELNASKTLLGFAESTFHSQKNVILQSTGSSKEIKAIDAFAHAIIGLWAQGLNVNWDQWNELFTFPEDLSLPEIQRPSTAVNINHELHRFNVHDYRAAWAQSTKVVLEQPVIYDSSSPRVSSTASELPSNSQLLPSPPSFNVAYQHQQTMRRVLESMERNTCLVLEQLNRLPD
jgi:acyl transferase domain-containing protein